MTDEWVQDDMLSMMQQSGLTPSSSGERGSYTLGQLRLQPPCLLELTASRVCAIL